MMDDWGYHRRAVWQVLLMGGLMLVFIAVLVVAAVLVIRSIGARTAPPSTPGPQPWPLPEQILAERFARGEMDETEYRRRRDALRERP